MREKIEEILEEILGEKVRAFWLTWHFLKSMLIY